MPLITRISRLFQADVHAVLDRIEEPGALLRQAVRDMETALAADERQLGELTRSQDALAARERDLSKTVEQLPDQLDACFVAGQEDLARSLIRRRLECERLAALLDRRRAALAERQKIVRARLEQNRARLEGMRQKAELLSDVDEDSTRDSAWSVEAETGPTVSDADVEVAFLREKQRRGDAWKGQASTKESPSPRRADS